VKIWSSHLEFGNVWPTISKSIEFMSHIFFQVVVHLKRSHAPELDMFSGISILTSKAIRTFLYLIAKVHSSLLYRIPNNKDTHGINTLRLAHVWMDEYIEFFFAKRPELRVNNCQNYPGLTKLAQPITTEFYRHWRLEWKEKVA
jgi:hypothetical protein